MNIHSYVSIPHCIIYDKSLQFIIITIDLIPYGTFRKVLDL